MTIDTTKEPENFYEAFKNALVLHITAPTKEESNEALYLAERDFEVEFNVAPESVATQTRKGDVETAKKKLD